MKKKLTVPNLITCIRIIGTLFLFKVKPLSRKFYIIYSICGLSDVLDGFFARLLKQSSSFGSKLDSVSDLFFYSTMLILLMPSLTGQLPLWLWGIVFLILLGRFALYLYVAVKEKQFDSEHTIWNKITGILVFGIAYFINTRWLTGYGIALCAVAIIALCHEFSLHIRRITNHHH